MAAGNPWEPGTLGMIELGLVHNKLSSKLYVTIAVAVKFGACIPERKSIVCNVKAI
jgi:hypothetical protein